MTDALSDELLRFVIPAIPQDIEDLLQCFILLCELPLNLSELGADTVTKSINGVRDLICRSGDSVGDLVSHGSDSPFEGLCLLCNFSGNYLSTNHLAPDDITTCSVLRLDLNLSEAEHVPFPIWPAEQYVCLDA
jgi:hypothetical protein